MLVDFRPGLVVVFPETAHLLPPTTAPCVAIGPVEDVPLRLDELASEQDTAPMESRARQDDLAVVVSSGGTTGVPKGSVRDFSSYTRMVAVPSPATRRQLANGKLAYLTQALVDTSCSAAARSSCRAHSSLLPPSPRSRPSGSPIYSWSNRNCSTSWIIPTSPNAT